MEFPGRTREPPVSRSSLILWLYAALSLLGLLIGVARGDNNLFLLDNRNSLWLLVSPLVGVAAGLLVVFLTRLCVHRFTWARRLHRDFRALLGALTARDLLILAAASSVGEELLFRGALLPWLGLLPSSIVFALLHVGPGIRFLPWTASAFLAGLLFGQLFLWLGDLGAPIVAHFTINYLNLNYIVRVDLPVESTSVGGR
ncbi:MAG: CPBP family intramembrane metalloprotease [Deltaproteobacteria bacterium]|nr:CPBP family intramembrane metalloprotease [Deltaproteobacteria bacterium]